MSVVELPDREKEARFGLSKPMITLLLASGSWALVFAVTVGCRDALRLLGV